VSKFDTTDQRSFVICFSLFYLASELSSSMEAAGDILLLISLSISSNQMLSV
jgi:hypothetical protein